MPGVTMARLAPLTLWLLAQVASAADPWVIPPPPRGQYALDLTQTLKASTVPELDRIAGDIDAAGVGQLGVVVLRTTSGVPPRLFTTALFNHWGIGHPTRNDGVLLLIALDDRKAELVVGSSRPLSQEVTDAIMEDDVVANMKRSDADAAVLAAARSIAAHLAQSPRLPAQGPPAPETDEALAAYVRRSKSFADATPRHWVFDLNESLSASQRADLEVHSMEVYREGKGRLVYLVFSSAATWPTIRQLTQTLESQLHGGPPLAVVAFNADTHDAVITLPDRLVQSTWEHDSLARATGAMRDSLSGFAALERGGAFAAHALTRGIPPRPMNEVLAAAFLDYGMLFCITLACGAVLGLVLLIRWNRYRPRACEKCHQPRERLGEAADDAHLSPGQREEEFLGSVNYDVWWCGRCKDALLLRYVAGFSRYVTCPSCNFRTASTSSTTITSATETSEGLVEVTTGCVHCGKTNRSRHTTARLPHSDSSWSSDSSSSSSSFDGGSSSGHGSSGSW